MSGGTEHVLEEGDWVPPLDEEWTRGNDSNEDPYSEEELNTEPFQQPNIWDTSRQPLRCLRTQTETPVPSTSPPSTSHSFRPSPFQRESPQLQREFPQPQRESPQLVQRETNDTNINPQNDLMSPLPTRNLDQDFDNEMPTRIDEDSSHKENPHHTPPKQRCRPNPIYFNDNFFNSISLDTSKIHPTFEDIDVTK